MKLYVIQSEYHDMQPCCDESLFNRGQSVPGTGKDRYIGIDDFGYFETFPVEWKFTEGREVSMCNYKYSKMLVKRDKEFEELPLEKNEDFSDATTHYPSNKNKDIFIAVSSTMKKGQWMGYLNVYRYGTKWKLAGRVKFTDYFRPIQFLNEEKLIILKQKEILLLNLKSLQTEVFASLDDRFYSNAHLSEDKKYLLGVTVKNFNSGAPQFILYDINTGKSIGLKKGENEVENLLFEINEDIYVPLRVDNGKVDIAIGKAPKLRIPDIEPVASVREKKLEKATDYREEKKKEFCCILDIAESKEKQDENNLSFIGGIPRIPQDIDIPKCSLCGSQLTFYFQVAFPEEHLWNNLTMAIFACTLCANDNYLTPEIIYVYGDRPGIEKGFLDNYQKNFKIMVFETQKGILRKDYVGKIKFKSFKLKKTSNTKIKKNKIGGNPNWIGDDESPTVYNGKIPMFFLMQILGDFQFEILQDAPKQIWFSPNEPLDAPYYYLFLGNNIYFFGTEDRNNPLVYITTKK